MRVHVVHAHPEPRSFVAAMRDVIVDEFRSSSHEVTVSDLYAMGFNPVASAADFTERSDPDYLVYALEQRHASARNTLDPVIRTEVDRVLAATNHELAEQTSLRSTEDFKEGVKATAERRAANFKGR